MEYIDLSNKFAATHHWLHSTQARSKLLKLTGKRRSAPVCHHEKSCCMEICQKSWLSISSWPLITAFSVSSSARREDLPMASTKRRLRCHNPSCPSADTCEFLGPGTQFRWPLLGTHRQLTANLRDSPQQNHHISSCWLKNHPKVIPFLSHDFSMIILP